MDQILQLDPKNELRFRGPFTEVVTAFLKLTNPSNERVCFKVKTTAPKKYCVRPNCGVIEPNESMNVQVMLQPFEYDPQERNKHKFMVQSVYAPEGVIINHEVFWKEVAKEMIMDSKLRCVFDMPDTAKEGAHATDDAEKEVFSPTLQHEVGAHGDSNIREELKRLQNEVFNLRKENSVLREDGLRHRAKNPPPATESAPSFNPPPSSSGPLSQVSHNTLLVYALMLIICGFILGKFIF